MFGAGVSVAVQNPSYPVYVDSSVILGMTGGYNGTGFDNIEYLVCRPETDFFPDLSQASSVRNNCRLQTAVVLIGSVPTFLAWLPLAQAIFTMAVIAIVHCGDSRRRLLTTFVTRLVECRHRGQISSSFARPTIPPVQRPHASSLLSSWPSQERMAPSSSMMLHIQHTSQTTTHAPSMRFQVPGQL